MAQGTHNHQRIDQKRFEEAETIKKGKYTAKDGQIRRDIVMLMLENTVENNKLLGQNLCPLLILQPCSVFLFTPCIFINMQCD